MASTASPASTVSAAAPAGSRLAFQVFRNQGMVGSHMVEFAPGPDSLEVRIAVDIAIGIGPLTLFRYRLRGTEQWRGNQLVQADMTTDNNGTPAFMRARRTDAGLLIEGSDGPRYLAPPGALAATHWNIGEHDAPMVNPQNGKLFRPTVVRSGPAPMPLPNGTTLPCRRFTLTGEPRLDLWYDQADTWCALSAPGKDGSVITYHRR
jgi:hypothetical protein